MATEQEHDKEVVVRTSEFNAKAMMRQIGPIANQGATTDA